MSLCNGVKHVTFGVGHSFCWQVGISIDCMQPTLLIEGCVNMPYMLQQMVCKRQIAASLFHTSETAFASNFEW